VSLRHTCNAADGSLGCQACKIGLPSELAFSMQPPSFEDEALAITRGVDALRKADVDPSDWIADRLCCFFINRTDAVLGSDQAREDAVDASRTDRSRDYDRHIVKQVLTRARRSLRSAA
jgi:hypothetical protein